MCVESDIVRVGFLCGWKERERVVSAGFDRRDAMRSYLFG